MVVDDARNAAMPKVTKFDPRSKAGGFSTDSARLDEAAELGDALERQTPVLLAAARALLRNEADARDLVQVTLEIAYRKAGDLRDPAALRAWLLAIQVREAFRLRRRLARLIRLNPEIAEISSSPGPDANVIALRAALPRLPPRARAAVVLHYLAGLPVSEVARAMGISENTTKGHLKAGLARLREELKDD
jgi:RNA polymerase sigma factor (sigma-70 family)